MAQVRVPVGQWVGRGVGSEEEEEEEEECEGYYEEVNWRVRKLFGRRPSLEAPSR